MKGYDALRNEAAKFELSGRGKIVATGEDRVRLIHAMSTNNVQGLAAGEGLYAFFLNAQGRILADANIFMLEHSLLLDTEPVTAKSLYEHIDKFIIADDVTLQDAPMTTTAVEGPSAASVVEALGVRVPAVRFGIAQWGDRYVVRNSRAAEDGIWIFSAGRVELPGIEEADVEAVEAVRLEHGRPVYGVDFSEANIPQETGQSHALHFNKGCYLGQEIVERVRSRGHVNRLLLPLRIDAQQPPSPGTKVLAGDKEVGDITSAAFSPAQDRVVALAIIRAEAQNVPLMVNGASGTVPRTAAAS